jgi:hypothetical protein
MATPVGEVGLSYIGYSTDGTTWTSLAQYSASLRYGGGSRKIGEFQGFGTDYPEVQVRGKLESHELTIRLLYTYGTAEPYSKLRTLHNANGGTPVYFRWSVNSATASYWSAQGTLRSVPLPDVAADSGDPVVVDVVFRTPTISATGSVV